MAWACGRVGVVAIAIVVPGVYAGVVAAGAGSSRGASASILHYEYVINGNQVVVYDIDDLAAPPVKTFSLPLRQVPQGVAANAASGTLYVSFGAEGGGPGSGGLLAYDLLTSKILWRHLLPSGVDSIALTPDGRTIYVPNGEESNSTRWWVVDAETGKVTGSISAGLDAHDTCVGASGKFVYLGGVETPYLEVASTATNAVVEKIGPLHQPGVRPFAINHSETLAFTTSHLFFGFQVSSIRTGKVFYSVSPPGFSFNPATYTSTPNHGIAVSPNGQQLALIDTANGFVHLFAIGGLPGSPPHDIADVKLVHAPPSNGWLEYSLDGRYIFVGASGDVISAQTHQIVGYLQTLNATTEFIEVDWSSGRPVSVGARCSS